MPGRDGRGHGVLDIGCRAPGTTTADLLEEHPVTEAPPPPAETSVDTPPAPPAPRPPWRRTVDDRVLGGVAGGLARTLGVDAVPVRIGLVVLGVLAFPLVLAYVAAWLLVPEDDAAGGVRRSRTDAGFWLGVALLAIVVVALAASLDGPGNGALVALALVGVGAALWRRDPGASSAATSTATPAWPGRADASAGSGPTTAATGTGTGTGTAAVGPGSAPAGPASSQPPPTPPPPRTPEEAGWTEPGPALSRRRSVLGPVTIALALIAAGVTAGLDSAGVIALDPSQITAVAMAVVGLGLLVGTLVGHARWLFLVALLLLPVVAGGSLVRVVDSETGVDLPGPGVLAGGAGERNVVVGADDSLPVDIGYGVGELQVDLRDATTATDARIDVDLAFGELRVLLPDDLAWDVTADVGLGEISVVDPGDTCGGTRSLASGAPARSVELRGGPGTGPVLGVDAGVAFGEIVLVCPDAA